MQIFVRLDLLLSDEKWIKKKIKQISLCVERIVCERIEIMWRSHVAVELKLALRKEKKRAAAAVDTNDSNFVARMEWAPRSDCTTNSEEEEEKSFTVSSWVRYEKESQSPSHLTLIAFLALFMCDEWELTFQS